MRDIREHKDKLKTWRDREELEREFSRIINAHSLENDSNTPDFILARFMIDCLINFHLTMTERIYWYNPMDKV